MDVSEAGPHQNSSCELLALGDGSGGRSFPDLDGRKRDVRSSSASGRRQLDPPRPKSANKRHSAFHSITSSARVMSVGGTSIPSTFAVFRLMANTNFVGSWTGKSAGFAPLRI